MECVIFPKGWIRPDGLDQVDQESTQGFVAMWFDDTMRPVYDKAFAVVIEKAGYSPHRVDNKEHSNKIVTEIRKNRFLFANLTKHREGVYFEAGFAKGLGVEVFWTCREDEMHALHFDVRRYNCIAWNAGDLGREARRLQMKIESVLGAGPNKPAYQ